MIAKNKRLSTKRNWTAQSVSKFWRVCFCFRSIQKLKLTLKPEMNSKTRLYLLGKSTDSWLKSIRSLLAGMRSKRKKIKRYPSWKGKLRSFKTKIPIWTTIIGKSSTWLWKGDWKKGFTSPRLKGCPKAPIFSTRIDRRHQFRPKKGT
jgi:hypothetical protein